MVTYSTNVSKIKVVDIPQVATSKDRFLKIMERGGLQKESLKPFFIYIYKKKHNFMHTKIQKNSKNVVAERRTRNHYSFSKTLSPQRLTPQFSNQEEEEMTPTR